jgi:hypothetical protein
MKSAIAAALLVSLPLAASAQIVSGIKVEPAEIKAGESAKITVAFDVTGGVNCGLRLHFGDGATEDYKINQTKDVPLVVTRSYPKAGSYEVKAEPKTVGMRMKCGGSNQTATLKVVEPAPVAKAAPAPAGPQCPDGWTLDKKSVNKKTGAFTCTAKSGTKPPESKLACPGDLGYFENAKKGQLGCRP